MKKIHYLHGRPHDDRMAWDHGVEDEDDGTRRSTLPTGPRGSMLLLFGFLAALVTSAWMVRSDEKWLITGAAVGIAGLLGLVAWVVKGEG